MVIVPYLKDDLVKATLDPTDRAILLGQIGALIEIVWTREDFLHLFKADSLCGLRRSRSLFYTIWTRRRASNEGVPTRRSECGRMRFANKTCIVTGGGSGIGKATCLQMAGEGGRVVVADLDLASAQATVDAIAAAGGTAISAQADVGNSAAVQGVVAKAVASYGKIDVIVNDAALMKFGPIAGIAGIAGIAEADFFATLTVNLGSVFFFSKYGVAHMGPGSAFVNVSSVHAYATSPNVVAYASSKGAIEAFTRGFALEMQPRNIRVNAVAPGSVDTPMLWNNPNVKSGVEKLEGPIGKPEDLSSAICFLASDEARFITGATLLVDGGRLAKLP